MDEILRQKSLTTQVYDLIKERILNLDYPAGTILNERQLSEEFHVSRSPVREALKALEAEDFVSYIPYKGVIVSQLGKREITEIFQMRMILEPYMVELSIENLTSEDFQALSACLESQKEIVKSTDYDYSTFVSLDNDFHEIINAANPNRILRSLITNFRSKIQLQALQSLYSGHERFQHTIEEHQAIINGLFSKDAKAAKAAMIKHIENAYHMAYQYSDSQKILQN